MDESISLIATVLNEGSAIRNVLNGIAAQERPPDEFVIVDGGSSDDTVENIRDWASSVGFPVTVDVQPGAGISAGRNRAIALAAHDLIAVTDAGTRMAPDWLALMDAAMEPEVDVVGGFFAPAGDSWFERALACAIMPTLREISEDKFLPSSRSVMFRRRACVEAQGYPEWLDYCEDLVFDLEMKATGARFAFESRAIVSWSARPNLTAFAKQYYRYARGDGKANLWTKRHAVRYFVYGASTAGLFARPRRTTVTALALGFLVYMGKPLTRIMARRELFDSKELVGAALAAPVLVVTGDVAKMAGYPVGVVWWLKNPDAQTATVRG